MSAMAKIIAAREFCSAEDALEQASTYLAAAQATAYATADKGNDESAYATAYLVEMAASVVNSVLGYWAVRKNAEVESSPVTELNI